MRKRTTILAVLAVAVAVVTAAIAAGVSSSAKSAPPRARRRQRPPRRFGSGRMQTASAPWNGSRRRGRGRAASPWRSWRRSSTGPRRPEDRLHRQRAGRHRGVARLDGQGVGGRVRRPAVPQKTSPRAVPNYALNAFSYGKTASRLYGVPVALENVGLVVNTRLAKVPEELGRPGEARPRLQARRSQPHRPRRAAGIGRRRLPHVPVLLWPVRLHLRAQPGRRSQPERRRAREQGLPQERAHDRPVEPDRPHQREGGRQHRQERLPRG